MIVLLSLFACNLQLDVVPEAECEERSDWYPDEDGDGVGDAGLVYIGCDPPEGWVEVPPEDEDVEDTGLGDTAHTGLVDTADTGLVDTGDTAAFADTSALHTGVLDSGAHTGLDSDLFLDTDTDGLHTDTP